jgi:2-polyprenyl-6-methoxyphenol hydroxylase-like FAD-dependent oxidoreductase
MCSVRILIVGAGIGGLTLAAFCEKTGIEYVLIEKQKDFSHHGYSLGLWSNARAILKKLEVQDKFDAAAIPFESFKLCDGRGRKVMGYDFSKFFERYGMGYSHVHRSDLVDWLSGCLTQQIHFSTTVESIQESEDSVRVSFSDGSNDSFDLVIACDGVSSNTRTQFFADDCRVYEEWRTWYMWIDAKYVDKKSVVEYVEPNTLIAVFYEGEGRALVTLNAKQNHQVWDSEEGRIERLKTIFKDHKKLVPEIFVGKVSSDAMPSDLSYIKLDKMYKGRIVLLGDAAHGFEPFAGLGASMAMEDAHVLVAELNQVQSLKMALRSFEKKRKERIKEARRVTMRMRKFLLVESLLVRKFSNFVAPLIPKSIFLRPYRKLLDKKL